MTDSTQNGAAHLTTADFDQAINSGKPVMVDFYADWCGPCQLAAPIIDKLAGEFSDKVTVAKLNVDENIDVARKYGVRSIPTVLVFKAGQVVDEQIGFPGEDGYRKMIDNALQ
jgi:thioredoxin 1